MRADSARQKAESADPVTSLIRVRLPWAPRRPRECPRKVADRLACFLQGAQIAGRRAQLPPAFRVAGEHQDLMAPGGIEENACHLLAATAVAVHQGVIEDDQGRFAG